MDINNKLMALTGGGQDKADALLAAITRRKDQSYEKKNIQELIHIVKNVAKNDEAKAGGILWYLEEDLKKEDIVKQGLVDCGLASTAPGHTMPDDDDIPF